MLYYQTSPPTFNLDGIRVNRVPPLLNEFFKINTYLNSFRPQGI